MALVLMCLDGVTATMAMKNKQDNQARKYQLTINNPAKHGCDHDNIKAALAGLKSTVYFCMADEVGEKEHTPHTHVYVAFSSPVRFSTLRKAFKGAAHIEVCRGTSEENRAYILKVGKWAASDKAETTLSGTFEEWGTLPDEHQGRRSDLADLYEQIKAGASDFQILENNPAYMRHIGLLEKTRQAIAKENAKNGYRELSIIYLYGEHGTGKTRYVLEQHGEDVFRVTDYKNAFDNYGGQKVICFDGYNGDFSLRNLLTYTEGYRLELPSRYYNRWAQYDTVYFISNQAPDELYKDSRYNNPTLWQAYLKRFTDIVLFTADGKHVRHEVTEHFQIVPVDELPLENSFGT